MSKFVDMPSVQIKRWVAFAQSHDWGEGAYFDDGKIYGCIENWSDGSQNDAPAFETPKEMRDWAGY